MLSNVAGMPLSMRRCTPHTARTRVTEAIAKTVRWPRCGVETNVNGGTVTNCIRYDIYDRRRFEYDCIDMMRSQWRYWRCGAIRQCNDVEHKILNHWMCTLLTVSDTVRTCPAHECCPFGRKRLLPMPWNAMRDKPKGAVSLSTVSLSAAQPHFRSCTSATACHIS